MEGLSFGMRKGMTGHSWRLMLVLIMTLTLAGLALPQTNGTVSAGGSLATSVFLEPPSQTASMNGAATVAIKIANVDNLYAAEVSLSFPTGLLEVQDFDPNKDGVQIAPSSDLFPFTPGEYYVEPVSGDKHYYSYSSDIGGYFIAQSEADNTGGTIDYRITLLSPYQPVSAGPDGKILATITFRCIAEGTANIDFASPVKLADAAGSAITVLPADIEGAAIGIVESVLEVETFIGQDQDLDGTVVIPMTIVRVKDPLTHETVTGVDIADYVANLTFTPGFMEILDITGGDPPFDIIDPANITIDNGAGTASVSDDISPDGVAPPIIAFRIVARLNGNALVSDTLSVNVTQVSDTVGEVMPVQAQPMALTFQRGDIRKPADGVVDTIDAMFGAQYIVGIRPVEDIDQLNMASVLYDDAGDIKNIIDCMFIAQYVVGIRNEYFELVP